MLRLLFACAFVFVCGFATAADRCLPPPTLNYRVRVPARLTYKIVGGGWTDEQKECVADAFWTWNTALRQAGRRIQFRQVTTDTAQITVLRASLGANVGGGLIGTTVDAHGYFTGAGLAVTSFTANVSSCATMYKVVLHEIGHVLGLDDVVYNTVFSDRPVPSVMNAMGGTDDDREFIPPYPTSCDVAAIPYP